MKIKTLLIFSILFYSNQLLYSWDPPKYTVIIDPGHGGYNQMPFEDFGDKYDILSGKYLEKFKQGASFKEHHEREIVLMLSKELNKVLELTKTEAGFREFRKIAAKYTKSKIEPIYLNAQLTRTDDYSMSSFKEGEDMNQKYRLYDFPDKKTGKKQLGRISWINQQTPHLIVSIHLNPSYPGHPGGMAAVIAPPYAVFQKLRLISRGKMSDSSFAKSPYSNWLQFVGHWNHLQNAMADTWIYFHGYWPDKTGKKTDKSKFTGYRHNMITWKYADPLGWEDKAKLGGKGPYSISHEDFIARGNFWNRERGQGEKWRRSGGREGYGGDNFYASNELLRFVQYGLSDGIRKENGRPIKLGPIQPPYISTYSLPTYTNAICAFLEIGYIDNDRDMRVLMGNSKLVAESLAVGIYSLFRGIKPIKKKYMPYLPKGKKLGFEKYESLDKKNYFREVAE